MENKLRLGIDESLECRENYSEHFIECHFTWIYVNVILVMGFSVFQYFDNWERKILEI